jgi:hypothetical protein
MDEHRLDALVAPSNAPAWRIDYANGDHHVGGNSTPAAVAGYPNVTVPMGFAFDLPIGISFIRHAWSEGTLIRLASAFEHATHHRLPPRIAPGPEPADDVGDVYASRAPRASMPMMTEPLRLAPDPAAPLGSGAERDGPSSF